MQYIIKKAERGWTVNGKFRTSKDKIWAYLRRQLPLSDKIIVEIKEG